MRFLDEAKPRFLILLLSVVSLLCLLALTPNGEDPFAVEQMRNRVNAELLLDSLLTRGGHYGVWVILDIWGIPSIYSIKGQHDMVFSLSAGRDMEVALLRRGQ